MTPTSPTLDVTVDDRLATVCFQRFDLEAYELFLRCKKLPESRLDYDWESDSYTLTTPKRFATLLRDGLQTSERSRLPLAPHLFDNQAFIVEQALKARRFADWKDTGLGKTGDELEFARQVALDGKVLLLAPSQVIPQTVEEAANFYGGAVKLTQSRGETRVVLDEGGLPIQQLRGPMELVAWLESPLLPAGQPGRVAIINPEVFVRGGVISELRYLAGLVVDESSLLKTGGGVIKWNLIKSAKGIEYKLSATATPAPNDTMEYASQASFLEKLRDANEILWTFFSKRKEGSWYIKPHAKAAFYEFMASWSIYMRNPAHYGFSDILATLPDPEVIEHTIALTPEQTRRMREFQVQGGHGLFNEGMGVQQRQKLSELAKGFLYVAGDVESVPSRKPGEVADIVRRDVRDGRQVIVWTVFDEESRILEGLLQSSPFSVVTLHGKTPEAERFRNLEAFRHGEVDVLISKARLVGKGLNFQNCRSMVFSGFDDSFEAKYQAIRRCVRFGQTESVRVHFPVIPELEGLMFDNVKQKEANFERDVAEMEAHYLRAMGMGAAHD